MTTNAMQRLELSCCNEPQEQFVKETLCTHFQVTLTAEEAELITNPIEFDPDLKRTYRKDRVRRAEALFSHVFGPAYKPKEWILGTVFTDGIGMLGQAYDLAGAEHFAIVRSSTGEDNGWTAYHVKTLGGRFTAYADISTGPAWSWTDANQHIESKADWGIRGHSSDDDDERVCHDDGGGYNPGGCTLGHRGGCDNGCRYCAKGLWSDDSDSEQCTSCLTGCRHCMGDDYPDSDEDTE
jgi:hypothetical protein